MEFGRKANEQRRRKRKQHQARHTTDSEQGEKRYMRNEVRTHCIKLTGINDTVECVSLQETFDLHVKA